MTARSRRWSRFSYRLSVPSEVDTENVDATMDHGLLTIHLPRSTEPRSRRISIGRTPGEAGDEQRSGTTGGEPTDSQGTPRVVHRDDTSEDEDSRPGGV